MPLGRVEKLAADRREALLDRAAREFAACGFEQASINRILEQAGMSKGRAYYYFEDKADLFIAVVQHVSERLQLADLELDPGSLTAESFWPAVAELRRVPLLRSLERPWLFAMIGVSAQVPHSLVEREPLASLSRRMRQQVAGLIQRGQELGVVRTDLPDDLILAWLLALDQASDRWLMGRWEGMDRAAVALASDQLVAALRSALAPGSSCADLASGSPATRAQQHEGGDHHAGNHE